MFNHAPDDYKCPICLGAGGTESPDTLILQSDIVFKDKKAIVFMSSFQYASHPIHVIISPSKHYENLYDLPSDNLAYIHEISKKVALALKEIYQCEGVTLQQNNEPAGDQHVFHYHLHVFPRFMNDDLYEKLKHRNIAMPALKSKYAGLIRNYLLNK